MNSSCSKDMNSLWWLLQACMLSCFSHVWLFVTLWTVARKAPLSMGFSRQEYWSGLPCPPPGDLPDPGIEPMSLASSALVGKFLVCLFVCFLPLAPPGKPNGFWGRVFKDKVRERVTAWSVCAWFSDWLTVRSRSHHYQFSGASWSGGCVRMVIGQLASSTWRGF